MHAERDVEVSFTKAGPGCADCRLKVGGRHFTLEGVSDTTDALGDFVRAALQIATGGRDATASFDREPAEWRVCLERRWEGVPQKDVFRVKIFEGECHPMHDFGGETTPMRQCFEVECDPDAFARAVQAAADAVRKQVQSNGYADWWDLPFPVRACAALETALASPPAP